jgi:hypothetical protein
MGPLFDMLTQRVEQFAAIGAPCLLEQFVIRNSVERKGDPLPRDVKKARPRECFMNAAHLATRLDGVEYYEGLAITDRIPLPIHHAWVVRDGVLIDNTWANPRGARYMGVHIPKPTLIKTLIKQKVYGVLDPGTGYNFDLMSELDPGFEAIIEQAITQFNQRIARPKE